MVLQEGIRTAGIIVREGVSGGNTPSVQVLEIGTLSSKRHPSDILPFLPGFRHLLQSLPTRAADMTLKTCKVPLLDVECLTNTLVKIGGPIWYLNIKKGKFVLSSRLGGLSNLGGIIEAMKFADKEVSKLCSSWTTPIWDEMDWDRMKELQVRDVLEKRQEQAAITQSCRCLQCPDFLKHVGALFPLD